MNARILQSIPEIKRRLGALYGNRLKGVILYGSEARSEAAEDSDIDMLVLLEGPVKFGEEARRIIHALYPVQLEVIRPIHAIPVDSAHYDAGEFALYRRVKSEGIPV